MRVLHLNTHSSGGSYEYAALLSTTLAEQGIEGDVVCKNVQSTRPGKPLLDRVIRRSFVSLSREPWHGTRRLLSPPTSEELEGVDVLHLHTVADWFDVPSWLETLPPRIAVVISLHDVWHFTGGCFLYHGCDLYSDTCTPCPILRAPFNRVLAKDEQRRKLQAYRHRRPRFVANSRWLAQLAQQSPIVAASGGARVIAPGIDTDAFRPQDKAQCRAKLGIAPNAFVVATGAASLTDTNKNVRWFLEQLAQLSEVEKVTVLLAGEGTLELPVGLNVRSMGGIADHRKRAMFYSAADVFGSASLIETYGLALIEAMSCGTPVVAFRTGGIPEAVPDGEAGVLCEPLDGAAFVAAIERLRSSPRFRAQLGTTASKLAFTRNGKAKFAGAFKQLYQQCVSPGEIGSSDPADLVT